MPIVSNTSPILNLAIIGQLDLLRQQFAEMDEHDGRVKAKALGLQPIGLLGVLLHAKRTGVLESVEAAMHLLRQRAGFFIAADLFNQVLREAGEQP
jgi:predicted nucleic acid-binding protein